MPRWTDDEVNYLKENAEYGNYQEIADELGRSYSSVKSKANKLDINTRVKWTDEKNQYLRENYPDKSDKEIADEIGCSEKAVELQRSNLGIVNEHLWTSEEEEFVEDNWRKMSDREIADELGRSVNSIRNRRQKLDIERPEEHSGKFNLGMTWTDEKVNYLKNNYSDENWRQIADKLGTSHQGVTDKARRLNLEKQERWTESETEFLKNNWQQLSDHEIACKLDKKLHNVQQKRSKRLNLVREDPSGNKYKWREWEEKCEAVANKLWDDVEAQHSFDEGYRADIYLPSQNKVVEVKWSYYHNWNAEKYLECEGVDQVVVWCYHETPANSCILPVYVRYDLFNILEDETIVQEIKQIKETTFYQSKLEPALEVT